MIGWEFDLLSKHSENVPLANHIDGFDKDDKSSQELADQSETQEVEHPEPSIADPNNTDGQINRHYLIVALNLIGMVFVCDSNFDNNLLTDVK